MSHFILFIYIIFVIYNEEVLTNYGVIYYIKRLLGHTVPSNVLLRKDNSSVHIINQEGLSANPKYTGILSTLSNLRKKVDEEKTF